MTNLLVILILIIGGLNWASIGFLQYDYIAGFFGTQASIFSRLIYICIGIATLYFIFMIFKYKGSVKIFDRKSRNEKKSSNNNTYTQTVESYSQNRQLNFENKSMNDENVSELNKKDKISKSRDILSWSILMIKIYK